MSTDEKEYVDGFETANLYCSMSRYSAADTFCIKAPRGWSEAKENGFYDALAEYRKQLENKERT
jgi:hypothetical protein